MSFATHFLAQIGVDLIRIVRNLGRITIFTCDASMKLFAPPFRAHRIIDQFYFIGVVSLFVVVLTALFTGMVLGIQGYYTLSKFGSEGLLGSAVALSLIRELGPVLTALMVTGRAGSSIAANLGVMRISEQIDALHTMDINPITFLVTPRITAAVLSLPLLTAIFDMVGILGGYLTGVVMMDVNAGAYISGIIDSTTQRDIVSGIVKALVFGLVIASISCFRGYHCDSLKSDTKGAEGVSYATTSSVVMVSVTILVLDYVITAMML